MCTFPKKNQQKNAVFSDTIEGNRVINIKTAGVSPCVKGPLAPIWAKAPLA